MSSNLLNLQAGLGISFRNHGLLRQAFTHSSYVNEHRNKENKDNERMEFLGDAVLELLVSEYLFVLYPEQSEGELTRIRASIVCEPSLVKFAEMLDFGSYILLGKGEEVTGGRTRPALLADVFESFIGALFLDQGLEAVKQFMHTYIFPTLKAHDKKHLADYKTKLQELTQQHSLGTVEYQIVDERGPAHEREFISEVLLDGNNMGNGSGRSKKESEQQAAAQALEKLYGMHKKINS